MWSQQVATEFLLARETRILPRGCTTRFATAGATFCTVTCARLRLATEFLLARTARIFVRFATVGTTFCIVTLPNGGPKKETLYTLKEKFDIMSRYGFQ